MWKSEFSLKRQDYGARSEKLLSYFFSEVKTSVKSSGEGRMRGW